ncbi:MAG: cytochrome c [Candidatus Didemnitutus sp.]|nr:cytochrome c [Candidatus Didemnitutus sp.]
MSKLAFLFATLAAAVIATIAVGRFAVNSPELAAVSFAPAATHIAPAALVPLVDPTSAGLATAAQIARGARTYRALCFACHLPDGKGMVGATPPLANSDYMFADRERAVRIVLKGQTGPIVVNGVNYNGVMLPLEAVLTDQQVADVLTYVYNSWGNQGDAFDPAYVAAARSHSVR